MSKPTMEEVRNETCYSDEEKNLFDAVMEQMGADWDELWKYPSDSRDASAGVSGFIYYTDTESFAEKNIRIILACLQTFEEECGILTKDKDNILNWYAWFALEHIIDKIVRFKEDYSEEDDEEDSEEESEE